MSPKNPARTRIAPSPTGQDLHIGNAYTALINYVVAQKYGGDFIIRIEDTDRTRYIEGSEQRILASLEWLGIPHAEGPDIGGPYIPYRQSERLPIYKKYAEELISKGHAYYCFCTPERLEQMRKNQEANHLPPMYDGLCKKIDPKEALERVNNGEKHVVRLNVPEDGVTTFQDLIRGEISFENKLIDDQVLLKSDGFPTYHLGVVVDDHSMKITHVIRGEEWISSTPKHILLYKFFGWELPSIAHLSVLRNPDKSKLSKRKNPVWVSLYREQGFLPEAIKNYLALMAWSYPDGRDIFSVQEMIEAFDLTNAQTTAPIFDIEKLKWMNGQYLKKLSPSDATDLIYNFFHGEYDKDKIVHIFPLVIERMRTLAEFKTLADFFFHEITEFDKPVRVDLIELLAKHLSSVDWNHDSMEQIVRTTADEVAVKAKEMFMELRIAITGKTVGPPLLESLEVLGKEETLRRLKNIK